MRKLANDCGARNAFGYYDSRAGEIILKRPCLQKGAIDEAGFWLDQATELSKLSIGIGATENFSIDDLGDSLYGAARGVIHQNLMQNLGADNEILRRFLPKIAAKEKLRSLSLKCFIFSEDALLFDMLLRAVRQLSNLVYLDFGGCYFSDEQLLELSEVISKSRIAHLVWPEPRMSDFVISKVLSFLKDNRSIVIMQGVPLDFQQIAQNNREHLFSLARRPTMIGTEEAQELRNYADSIRLGIAYEKQRVFDLEKSVEAVLA